MLIFIANFFRLSNSLHLPVLNPDNAACANIGAVADFIDPRPDSMDIMANAQKVLEVIKYERAKYIVALDKCYLAMLKPIEKELKELGIENIVIISASDSMNLSGKIDYLKDALKYNELKNIRNNNLSVKKLKSYEVLYARMSNMQKEEKYVFLRKKWGEKIGERLFG